MASGQVNRAEQAEHMAAPTNAAKREESPCQLGAVHTWPVFTVLGSGRARQLCPGISDLDFLGDLDRIVELDAKISNRAFDLRMTQQ